MLIEKRKAGILLPIFSLPSDYGIGTLGKEALAFIDCLQAAQQSFWQVLPLGHTGYGNSPYQCFSAFAGNPYFIDLQLLCQEKLLCEAECAQSFANIPCAKVDYALMETARLSLLKRSFSRFDIHDLCFVNFCQNQDYWLEDYALFMALKQDNQGKPWYAWPQGLKNRCPSALIEAKKHLKNQTDFYKYVQFQFFKQWNKLHQYAKDKQVQIIGDMPFYVALDSCDVWANPGLFQLDSQGMPLAVAGCPPDAFSATGQLWGNPLYHWQAHMQTNFAWWVKRIAHSLAMYDVLRLDHFRGFEEYYSIPFGQATAQKGQWQQGPGILFFKQLKQDLGQVNIIAEDLGQITPSVRQLLKETGFWGMKVMQFAFSEKENSEYLLHNHIKNCVVYTGTHDNQTLAGWIADLSERERAWVQAYTGTCELTTQSVLCHTFASVANVVIIPMQDYLGLGNEARINTPATLDNNWQWRMKKEDFSLKKIENIKKLTQTFFR